MRHNTRLKALENRALPKDVPIVIEAGAEAFNFRGKQYPMDKLGECQAKQNLFKNLPSLVEVQL